MKQVLIITVIFAMGFLSGLVEVKPWIITEEELVNIPLFMPLLWPMKTVKYVISKMGTMITSS